MTGTPRNTFPREQKLKSRKQIDLVFSEGKSFFAAPVKCYFRFEVSGLKGDQLDSDVKTETTNVQPGGPANPNSQNTEPETSNPKPQTPNLKPETSNPQPQTTINNKQQTINIKAGFSVSKRNFKHSVDRNRIKRLLREAFRLHKHKLAEKLAGGPSQLEVFFVFTDRSLPAFDLVEEKMKYCLRRLAKIAEGGL